MVAVVRAETRETDMLDAENGEIRQLTAEEMDAVSGAWLKTAVGIVAGWLLAPTTMPAQEWWDKYGPKA
jgi:hypothetical protein